MNEKRNNCLTLLKMIACFGVVFIHFLFPGKLGIIIKYSFSFAVPIFIMIAGYYSYGCENFKIKKRLLRTLKIFIFGYLCYFLFYFLVNLKNHNINRWISENINIEALFRCIIFCKIDFCLPLWYLIAMSETYLLWLFALKYNKVNALKKMTFVLLLAGTLLTIIVDTLDLGWMYKTNFICKALPWFLIGYQIREIWESRLTALNNFQLLIYATLGLAITLFPVILGTRIDFNDLGVLLTAPSLFLLGVKNPDIKIDGIVRYIGDTLSLYIYIFHLLVSKVFNSLFERYTNDLYLYIYPLLILTLTIVVSHFFVQFLNKTNMKKIFY